MLLVVIGDVVSGEVVSGEVVTEKEVTLVVENNGGQVSRQHKTPPPLLETLVTVNASFNS